MDRFLSTPMTEPLVALSICFSLLGLVCAKQRYLAIDVEVLSSCPVSRRMCRCK